MPEPQSLIRVHSFPSVVTRHRGHEVGVDDPAFERIQRARMLIVLKTIRMEVVFGPPQPGGPQHLGANQTLVAEIVDGEAYPLVLHAVVFVNFEKEHRDQHGLPVVAVDHLRPLVRFEQVLQRRLAEEGVTQGVVGVTLGARPVEEVVP